MHEKLGQAIRERRKQLGLSQLTVAFKSGVNPCIVSRIECGYNARLDSVLAILQVLELELTFK